MSNPITWDNVGERLFETGVDRGVLYPYNVNSKSYTNGVAWNGITSFQESPSGADVSDLYADNIKYLSLRAAENYGGTLEAYTYPDEFADLDGTRELCSGVRIGQQSRGMFGLCYRTRIGNDSEGDSHGYKLHIIYGATASPSSKSHETVNENPAATTFSWEISTTPVTVAGYKPTAKVEIDSTKVSAEKMAELEGILYGSSSSTARLPLPDEIASICT